MITMKPGNYINEYYGLSTDTKPTDPYVPNASIFYEMDTGDIYLYDAANGEWVLQPSLEGGGGSTVETDKTLTRDGVPADAKAAGDGLGSIKNAIAPEFDENEYYEPGAHVWHDGNLYCIGDYHDEGVSWEDTYTNMATIRLDLVKNAIAKEFNEYEYYEAGTYVWHDGGLYYLDYYHEEGVSWEDTSVTSATISDGLNAIKKSLAENYYAELTYNPETWVWRGNQLRYLPNGHTAYAGEEDTVFINVSLTDHIRDIKHGLQDVLSTSQESTSYGWATATRDYAIGDYILVDGNALYKATAAITTGQQLAVGTNVVLTNVMAEIAGNAGLASAIKAAIAPEFDASDGYSNGDYVWHNGSLYVLTDEHESGVSWENTSAEPVVFGNELSYFNTSLATLDENMMNLTMLLAQAIAQRFDESKVHDVNTYVWHDGKLYRIDSAHAPGVTWENTVCTEVVLADEMALIAATASVAINDLNTAISELEAEVEASVVTVTGTNPTITAESNTRYVCGEVQSISITPPASGICDVTFTSGSTAAVLTVPNTVRFPSWFDATTLEANTIYEINISDGLAAVMTWAV